MGCCKKVNLLNPYSHRGMMDFELQQPLAIPAYDVCRQQFTWFLPCHDIFFIIILHYKYIIPVKIDRTETALVIIYHNALTGCLNKYLYGGFAHEG